jgi:light-regulated signal transduction histidine kinase (bacteriophytochrome)
VPVVGEDGVPVGVLGVFYSLPREPGTADRDLALRAVRLARLAIQRRADEGRIRELNEDLERRVESRTRELQASLRELESFSYTISHDLRTPLRAIDGYVHILLEDHGPGLDAVARDRLEKVSGGARRMAQLIDGLLAFSRVPRAHFADEQVDMAALVNAALDELAPIRGRARIVVGRLPRAHGDAMLLRQVWTNLIANALKFSAQRNEPLVEIGADDAGDETVYHVRDNGVGFEQQYAGKLFGVFERLHGVQEFDGVGVGLAIVARIVHRHGGRTWAEGRLDAGATFRFALPARPGSTPE